MANNEKPTKFGNLLAFMVLMCGESIMPRSPNYICEKFRQYTGLSLSEVSDSENQERWLDHNNLAIWRAYLENWNWRLGGV